MRKLVLGLFLNLIFSPMSHAAAREFFVYVGTYTRGDSPGGIHVLRFDPEAERLETTDQVGVASNPAFVAIHPGGGFLYAVGEWGEPDANQVIAYAIDPQSGGLTRINRHPSGGKGPCHLVVDPSGRWVLVANYGDGGVATVQIDDDGGLGPFGSRHQHRGNSVDPQRQTGPHAHSINLTPDGRRALVADLGLDKVMIYWFDSESGKLIPSFPPFGQSDPGSGPRHLAFNEDGTRVYVLNEMAASLTVFSLEVATGALESLQSIDLLPQGWTGERSGAEVVIHPNGRTLYASNRGHDSIAIFSVDANSGRLRSMGHVPSGGRTPRNFAIDPTGGFLFAANQNSDSIVVFRIGDEGQLMRTDMLADVPSPVCIRFLEIE